MNKYIIIIIVLWLTFISYNLAFAKRDLPDNNLSYPVLILLNNSTGSGFYLNSGTSYYFVTARHVLFDAPPAEIRKKVTSLPENTETPVILKDKLIIDKNDNILIYKGEMSAKEQQAILEWAINDSLKQAVNEIIISLQYKLKSETATLISYSSDIENTDQNILELNLNALLKSGNIKYSTKHDIVIVKIGDVSNENQEQKISFAEYIIRKKVAKKGFLSVSIENLKEYKNVFEGNEVFVFGYPTSLGLKNIPQIDYNRPLLRKGIVAGKNASSKTIIIDCPVYFGNSGGPVVEVEATSLTDKKFKIIGLVSEYIPFVEEIYNRTQKYSNINVSNSGYAVIIPVDFLLELIKE